MVRRRQGIRSPACRRPARSEASAASPGWPQRGSAGAFSQVPIGVDRARVSKCTGCRGPRRPGACRLGTNDGRRKTRELTSPGAGDNPMLTARGIQWRLLVVADVPQPGPEGVSELLKPLESGLEQPDEGHGTWVAFGLGNGKPSRRQETRARRGPCPSPSTPVLVR